jgi:TetR/AcrR family transcriptional regulator, regulator of cefoperazone and chloramphenicol sensitivity
MPDNAARRLRREPFEEGGRPTRDRLLETAGTIFAEKGFDRTTGKEICAKAGANVASINYYFGSIEGLYAAVLDEAQRRFITFEAISTAAAASADPKAKLRAIINLAARRLTAPVSTSWVFRVLAREIAAPSSYYAEYKEREILPRALLMKTIVASLVDLPPEHPAVARASLSIIAPFVMLSIADRNILRSAFPSLSLGEDGARDLADHLYHYAVAGLAAVRKAARK